jgi:hypothetical protein
VWNTSADFPLLGRATTNSLSIVLEEASTVNINLDVYFNRFHGDEEHSSFVVHAVEDGGSELLNDFGGPIRVSTFPSARRNVSFSTTMNLTAGTWTVDVDIIFGNDMVATRYSLSAFAVGLTGTDTYSWEPVLRDVTSNPTDGVKTSYPTILPSGIAAGDGILIFMMGDDSGTWTAPSGYSVLFGPVDIGSSVVFLVYKVAGASEPDPTWTNSPFGDHARFLVMVFRGGPASITNVQTKQTVTTSGFSESTFPAITTASGGSVVVFGYANGETNETENVLDAVTGGSTVGTRPKFGIEGMYEAFWGLWYNVQESAGAVTVPTLAYSSDGLGEDVFQFCAEVPV